MILLGQVRAVLEEHYGPRLAGVVLFGSVARGTEDPESDIDLLVLLRDGIDCFSELRILVGLIYPLQLDAEREISAYESAGAEMSLRRVAGALGIAVETAGSYLEAAEAAYMLFSVRYPGLMDPRLLRAFGLAAVLAAASAAAAEPAAERSGDRPTPRDSYISYGGISSLPTRTAWGAFETGCPDPDRIPKGDDVETVRHRVLECLESGRDRARLEGDRRAELAYETKLAWVFHISRDEREAGARERALHLARRIGDGCWESLLLWREVVHDPGPMPVGERLSRMGRALGTARASSCLPEQALVLREMAVVLPSGDPGRIEMLERAASLARAADDPQSMALVFSTLSRRYAEAGDPRAIDLGEEIVGIWAESGDRRGWKIAHWNLGVAYEMLGRLAEAAEHKGVYSGMYAELDE